MDVVADSNTLIQLIFGAGRRFTETSQFSALLTYLRRVNSRLILTLPVFQEVVEVYRRELVERTAKAEKSWEDVRRILVSDGAHGFSGSAVRSEVNELRRRLRNPSASVRTRIYAGYDGIDTGEILRRGIKRIPPANSEGEELRDVALWLTVLKLASVEAQPLAFITNDKHFLDESRSGLHPVLLKDVRERGVDIRFYPSFAGFVAGNSISSEPLSDAWSSEFLPLDLISSEIRARLASMKVGEGTVNSVAIAGVTLVSGDKYEVGPNSYYIEAKYSGTVDLVVLKQVLTGNTIGAMPFGMWNTEPRAPFGNYLGGYRQNEPGILSRVFGANQAGHGLIVNQPINYVSNVAVESPWSLIEVRYSADVLGAVSARVVNGIRESIQVDRTELTNIRDTEPPRP